MNGEMPNPRWHMTGPGSYEIPPGDVVQPAGEPGVRATTKRYIAGPMTGYEDWNFPAFAAVAAYLRSTGETVISPHEIPFDDKTDNPTCLRLCLRALLDCDGLVLLPGWRDSKGATVEHGVAAALDMPIHELTAPVLRWLQEQP